MVTIHINKKILPLFIFVCLQFNLRCYATFNHGNKNTGIPPIKIPNNIARRNHYPDPHCILTVMTSGLMPRVVSCKKPF